MTAPRWETVNEDARACMGCGELTDVDAAWLCDACADIGEHPPLPFLRLVTMEGTTDE